MGILFEVLWRFGLGDEFVKWIQTLYRSPQASVLTNGMHSPAFSLNRGTRQGCTLSPLLFALVIEPLAETIRNHANIVGIDINRMKHVIALYADVILLFLTKPE